MTRHTLLALGALLSVACISVPSYPTPDEGATLIPGFDPSANQSGRWLCDDYDFVRVNQPSGDVLVEMNTDTVIEAGKKIPGGGTEFTFKRYHGILLRDTGFKGSRILVPDDAGDPVTVTFRDVRTPGTGISGIVTTYESKQQCKPAPPVKVIQ